MKTKLQDTIRKTRTCQFLIRKCKESDVWAWGVTVTGIGLMVLVVLL